MRFWKPPRVFPSVLLLVVLSGRFIQFLEKAASGALSIELMFTMILWRIPSSLELILPLALTLSVLLVLGRMSLESELTILRAAGYSNRRLFGIVLVPATAIALLVGWLSLVLSPEVARELDRQVIAQENLTVFDTVVPGRFQTDKSGRLIYAEGISDDRESLIDVFIVEPSTSKEKDTEVFLTGKTARQELNAGEKYLVLLNGYRHIGTDTSLEWEISKFERYLIRLDPEIENRPESLDTKSTKALLASGEAPELAIVSSWRISLPIVCLLMLPVAFLIGRGSPRQGRFIWVIPIILIQFGYITALSFAQKAITAGHWAPGRASFGCIWYFLAGWVCDRLWIICPQEGWVMSRSTWLLARAIWISFVIVFLVFFGLELVFRVLDEAKLPHTNYTAEEISLVSIFGMPRRLYLDLPLIVLIAVAAGLGGLAQSNELTILRAAGLSIRRIFLKVMLVLSPILVGSIVTAQYGMPEAERFSQALKDINVTGGIRDSVWTREAGRYVFIEGGSDGSVGLWKQIELAKSRDEIARLITSQNIRLGEGRILLSQARLLTFEGKQIIQQIVDLEQPTKLTDSQVRWLVQDPDALSLSELWDAASYLEAEGLNARVHSQLFWQRVASNYVDRPRVAGVS